MRKDGKRVKKVDPIYSIMPHILAKRSDSQNFITLDIPVGPMESYIRSTRKNGIKISHIALVTAAYVRLTAEFPRIGRFIVNRKIYSRNSLTVGMVVLKAGGNILEDETMSKINFLPSDDIFSVQKKMDEYIEKNRQTESNNKTDKLVRNLCSMTFLMRIAISLIKFGDKYGLLPKSLLDASPFHCNLVLTNLGSIRTNHIYHHIYDFGTVSQVISIGNMREIPKRNGKEIEFVRCLPLGVVMDERVCTGAYYATAFKRFQEYLLNPELLEGSPKIIDEELADIK